MQIVINVKRWHIILICSVLVLGFSGIYLALAQNQAVVGHSISEIFGGIFGQPIKLASGEYIGVEGKGGEQVYIGGDAVAGDVQLGSFNPNIKKMALWNIGGSSFMDLVAKDVYTRKLYIYLTASGSGTRWFVSDHTIKVWKYTGNNEGKGTCPLKGTLIVSNSKPKCTFPTGGDYYSWETEDDSFELVGILLVGNVLQLPYGAAPAY